MTLREAAAKVCAAKDAFYGCQYGRHGRVELLDAIEVLRAALEESDGVGFVMPGSMPIPGVSIRIDRPAPAPEPAPRLEEGRIHKGGVNREYQITQRPPDPPPQRPAPEPEMEDER